MEVKEAIEHILSGNCILFTGTGYSYGSKNILGQTPKIGETLTEFLYAECGIIEGDKNLMSASELYIEECGEFKLIDFLKNEYTITETSAEQDYLKKKL